MSISTDKMREEIKYDLCDLLKIPKNDEEGTIAKLIDKIISCAVAETLSTINKVKPWKRDIRKGELYQCGGGFL